MAGEDAQAARLLDDPRVIERVEAYREALLAGQNPDRQQLLDEFPDIADELTACLNALEFVRELAPRVHRQVTESGGTVADRQHSPLPQALGDFRILREIGRGGMGVVYEAEQLSLSRKVALKILPFAAVLDQRQLARFKNEAQAAAHLRHANIVPVYAVGCDRGVHYYAMQYIEGHTLAEVIGQLRQLAGEPTVETTGDESLDRRASTGSGVEPASDLAGGRFAPPEPSHGDAERTILYKPEQERRPVTAPAPETPSTDKTTQPSAALSTERSIRSREFFRTVAGLGVQAAEALDHAHVHGVLHRDVKPANFILDGEGKLWITDFGLAHMETHASLTISGDIMGTVRYMSPEQALAKRVVVDHRTDIYSLGVTLYELLTLRPLFPGQDRQELLRQIAFDEPRAPRRFNKSIPVDLETIVLKAIAKNPAGRFGTAADLAADLRRFLEDRPIMAKRTSAVTHVWKWTKRHKVATAFSLVTAVLVSAVLIGIWARSRQQLNELETAGNRAVAAAELSLAKGEYDLALGRLTEVDARLVNAPESLLSLKRRIKDVRSRAEAQKAQAEARRRVLRFRQLVDDVRRYSYYDANSSKVKSLCEQARSMYHLPGSADSVTVRPPAELRSEVFELLLLLAKAQARDYSRIDEAAKEAAMKQALDTLRLADNWRSDSPALVAQRALFRERLGDEEGAKADREEASDMKPTTALDHFLLGEIGEGDGAAHYRAALELEPDHAPSFMRLGQHYKMKKQPEQAELCFTICIALLPEKPFVYQYRGIFYQQMGEPAKAVADFTEALRLQPDFWAVLELRAIAHSDLKRYQDAIDDYTAALELVKDNKLRASEVRMHRGYAYLDSRQLAEALADFDRAAKAMPLKHAEEVARLLVTGPDQMRNPAKALALFEAAVAAHRERVAESPSNRYYRERLATSLHDFGFALASQGRDGEAAEAYGEAVAIFEDLASEEPNMPNYQQYLARGYVSLINVLKSNERWNEAGLALRKAQKLKHGPPFWGGPLAWWLATWPDEEFRDPQRAIQLATDAVKAQPEEPGHWSNLGTANYRAGNWQEAVAALEKYNEHVHDTFFLAMAHWQLGDKEKARRCYHQAIERMQKDHADDEELARLCSEAAKLLEISDPPQADTEEALPETIE